MSNPTDKPLPVRPIPTVGVDPKEFNGAFRETFLAWTQDPDDHAALRAYGKVLNSFAMECGGYWPYTHLDATAHFLQSGLADLRHLQYLFIEWGEGEPDLLADQDEPQRHRELRQFSMRIARKLKKIADEIETEVGDWKFKLKA